jgi:hypothetical protein
MPRITYPVRRRGSRGREARAIVDALCRTRPHTEPRPQTRADCIDGPRPCPWYGCRHHLGIDVTRTGTIQYREIPAGEESCSLDVADAGSHTLRQIADRWGLSFERVRQLLELAAEHARAKRFEDHDE